MLLLYEIKSHFTIIFVKHLIIINFYHFEFINFLLSNEMNSFHDDSTFPYINMPMHAFDFFIIYMNVINNCSKDSTHMG